MKKFNISGMFSFYYIKDDNNISFWYEGFGIEFRAESINDAKENVLKTVFDYAHNFINSLDTIDLHSVIHLNIELWYLRDDEDFNNSFKYPDVPDRF